MAVAKKVNVESAVPLDLKGNPLVQISMAATELVPTGNYANVTVGPAVVTKYVADGPKENIADAITDLADIVEGVVGAERTRVLESIQS